MKNGFDEFKKVLHNFRYLSTWIAGASLAAPFVIALIDVVPPWPKKLSGITAIVELVVLIFTFQAFRGASRKKTNRRMKIAMIVAGCCALIYLSLFVRYTFVIPTTKEIGIKGFVCTPEAKAVFHGCDFDDEEALASAEYEAHRIWTPWSIDVIRLGLLCLWIALFWTISFFIGLFIVYQHDTPSVSIRKTRRTAAAE